MGKHSSAFEDLDVIIKSQDAPKNVILNALIKKATLYMQLENPDLAIKGFGEAIKLDETYGDIYHHSGQVYTEYIHQIVCTKYIQLYVLVLYMM